LFSEGFVVSEADDWLKAVRRNFTRFYRKIGIGLTAHEMSAYYD